MLDTTRLTTIVDLRLRGKGHMAGMLLRHQRWHGQAWKEEQPLPRETEPFPARRYCRGFRGRESAGQVVDVAAAAHPRHYHGMCCHG